MLGFRVQGGNEMQRRTFVSTAMAVTAGTLAGVPAWAQKITGDVRLLCGFAPGGTADLLCRILAEAVTPEIGQKVIVDTKTGASGFIANEALANSAPDGRTIGLAAMAAMCVSPVMPGQKLPINVDTDLTPIANIAGVYNMLVVGKHVPFRTVPDLIAYAKANPGKLSYASAGNGTSQHLAGELFKKMADVNILHVPYRGGAPAIQDIVAGNCDMMFGNMPEFLGQIGGGGLIPIAFGSPRVSPLFPNLPLISQFLPGFVVVNWFAVFGSKGMPTDIVMLWNKALRAAVAKPDMQKRFLDNGMDTVIGSPEELKATIVEDRKKWAAVIQEAGIRAD
ncbi:MAG: tripartite tricarboxylate transporter substrate binding protein [Alphaproteobacteria bacterium]|nr:tripartite tricarboxylate transporter substrate binding protein [Alphaproteobacteria bacterium]